MSQTPTPRRRRRRRVDEEDTTVSLAPSTPLSSDSIEPVFDRVPVEPEITTSISTSKLAITDRIRTELLEDKYHEKLVEPEYWDESHNWTDEGELVSSDYWHFLGQYE